MGVSICLISLLNKEDRDIFLSRYVDMFSCWFSYVRPWEESNLAKLNHVCICISGVPLFLWHEKFFTKLGMELGEFYELSPRTLEKKELWEAWFKIDLSDPEDIPSEMVW